MELDIDEEIVAKAEELEKAEADRLDYIKNREDLEQELVQLNA